MNYRDCLKLFVALTISSGLAGCSTISATKQSINLSAITTNKTYQLRVRSGNIALDRIIYDYASMKFGEYLQITEAEPFNNHIEIVFMSTLKEGFSGSSAGYTTNMVYGNLWFTGDDTPWSDNYYPASGTEIAPGRAFSRQNSAMTVIIKDINGQKFWKAIFNYRGGFELSGTYVKTADEAARISLDRVIKQFEKDFIIVPAAAGHESGNMPEIALIVEDGPEPGGP